MKLRQVLDATTRADRLLFLTLVALAVSGFFFAAELSPAPYSAQVDVDGKPAYRLPLGQNAIVAVNGKEGITTIEVKVRRVRIVDSPCPHKLCVKRGWISSGTLACVPNGVVVTIHGRAPGEEELDAISR